MLHLPQPATFTWNLWHVLGGGSAVDKTTCLLLFNYVALEPICASTVSVNDEAQEV